MRKIIVNSTPLILLSKIGRMDFLRKIYGKIIIPDAVYNEVNAKSDSGDNILESYGDWIEVHNVRESEMRKLFSSRLHEGEIEVMMLALQENADLVIIDDKSAKNTAKFLGINVTGTLGVIIKAKELGIITSIRDIIKEIKETDFYISDKVIDYILEIANEK